jgi:hypothetical protein
MASGCMPCLPQPFVARFCFALLDMKGSVGNQTVRVHMDNDPSKPHIAADIMHSFNLIRSFRSL